MHLLCISILQEFSTTVFAYGFASGLVSGVLILCGLAGLVAAVMFLMAKRRGQKTCTPHGLVILEAKYVCIMLLNTL